MTCREKLAIEYPEDVDSTWCGGCRGCPNHHGYLPKPATCEGGRFNSEHICTACWDREIPGTESLTYKHTTEPIGKVTELTTNDNGVTAKIEPTNSHYVRNEKEKNMATKKTKAELEKELETVKESKAELEKELKNLEKYKQYEDAAGEIHALYTSFVMAGFTDDQAFELVKTMIANAGQINFNASIKPTYKSYR
jgi:hypothetical protein